MQPLRGPSEATDDGTSSVHPQDTHASSPSAALTTMQRTALERTIVKIMAISSLKSAELWAGIRHQAGVRQDSELLASHFPAAEQWLSDRLSQEQNSHSVRVLLQQLSDLLPQGNNRQAVSHFIRQNFGQTVLSSLTQPQLQQVLTMLQSGEMDIPLPQQLRITDRTLLPAEHQNLQQQVIKLTISGGGSPASVWQNLFSLVSLKNGDPIPSRYYPLLTQYLNARVALRTQTMPVTLPGLLKSLKQPPSEQEIRHLTRSSQTAAPVQGQPLSAGQAEDVLHQLFRYRAEQLMLTSRKENNDTARPQATATTVDPAPGVLRTEYRPYWLIAALVIIILAGIWLF